MGFRDSYEIHAWHGVRTTKKVIEAPQLLTVDEIESETNAEIKRVMIERFGQAKYLLESGAKEIHRDDFGTLYQKEIKDDEPLVMVKVVNSTPEPDGSMKDYFLRVDPQLRILFGDKKGQTQKMIALNAVASTFGMTGSEYAERLSIQT